MKIELTCFLYNKKMVEDLGIETEDIIAKITIDTNNIETVRERVEDGDDKVCKKTCILYMKSGESFMIGKLYTEMIKTWLN